MRTWTLLSGLRHTLAIGTSDEAAADAGTANAEENASAGRIAPRNLPNMVPLVGVETCTRAAVSAGGRARTCLIGDGRGGPGFLESGGNPAGKAGAGEGIRPLDPDLGKVVLYP